MEKTDDFSVLRYQANYIVRMKDQQSDVNNLNDTASEDSKEEVESKEETNEVELVDVGNLTVPEGVRHFSRIGDIDSEHFFTSVNGS